MNRTTKEATVKRYYYDNHEQIRDHLQFFVDAYNHARRLKTLRGLTPYEFIHQVWTKEPERFRLDPSHHMPGPYIHRASAEAVAWDDGKLRRLGRVDMRRDLLAAFAEQLSADDVVVVEATGHALAVVAVLAPHVKKVVIANSMQVRMIAHAKIKTDTIDAGVLVQLYASGFLPEVWVPDAPTQALRRQVTRRTQIVRQRSRLKNIIQSILHSHLIPSCPHADLCGAKGRAWLVEQAVPEDKRLAIERHLREFDRLGEDLKVRAPTSRPALRHAVARAPAENSEAPRRKLLSIISVRSWIARRTVSVVVALP